MRLVFIGPQASGKGTQARIISDYFGICHVSTGDLLRGAEGDMGKKIHSFIDRGEFVPDDLMIEMLKERLKSSDCENGFILDGFPRNMNQAILLEKEIGFDKIIEINISDDCAVRRLTSRVICPKCGAVFNNVTNPSMEEGVCDECNSELIHRKDDVEDVIRKRLSTYHETTSPILEKYPSVKIDGEQPIESVAEDIVDKLSD